MARFMQVAGRRVLQHWRRRQESSMHNFLFSPQRRPLRLYLLGLTLVFAGTWAMGETGSMLPRALASSAGLMLSAPLLRQLIQRALRPAASKRR